MNILEAEGIKYGTEIPAICVPVTGADMAQLDEEIELVNSLPCQLVEWRADYLMASMKGQPFWNVVRAVLSTLGYLKSKLEKPVLLTIRTAEEGGEIEITPEDYYFVNRMVAESRMAVMIDIEAYKGDADMAMEFIEYAHSHDVMIILSNHDFNETPALESMVEKYETMIGLGCDIAKLAVMPECEEDVAELLQAAAVIHESHPQQMLVAISMGELGKVSRICAGHMGSVITFAAGREASAPGQIDAVTLQGYLEKYYR